MYGKNFRRAPWPPGRACTPPPPGLPYDVELYSGSLGSFALEFQKLADTLTPALKRSLTGAVIAAINDLRDGALSPVRHTSSGTRVGEVDRTAVSNGDVLELRLENVFTPKMTLIPNKKVRIYFCEPLYPALIVVLLLRPKASGKTGLLDQNSHIREAHARAHDWWIQHWF